MYVFVVALLSKRLIYTLFTIPLNRSAIEASQDGPRFEKRPSNEHHNRAKGTIMTKLLSRFIKDESGATAIEYGLIAALIALAIITGATALGTNLNNKFQNVADKLK